MDAPDVSGEAILLAPSDTPGHDVSEESPFPSAPNGMDETPAAGLFSSTDVSGEAIFSAPSDTPGQDVSEESSFPSYPSEMDAPVETPAAGLFSSADVSGEAIFSAPSDTPGQDVSEESSFPSTISDTGLLSSADVSGEAIFSAQDVSAESSFPSAPSETIETPAADLFSSADVAGEAVFLAPSDAPDVSGETMFSSPNTDVAEESSFPSAPIKTDAGLFSSGEASVSVQSDVQSQEMSEESNNLFSSADVSGEALFSAPSDSRSQDMSEESSFPSDPSDTNVSTDAPAVIPSDGFFSPTDTSDDALFAAPTSFPSIPSGTDVSIDAPAVIPSEGLFSSADVSGESMFSAPSDTPCNTDVPMNTPAVTPSGGLFDSADDSGEPMFSATLNNDVSEKPSFPSASGDVQMDAAAAIPSDGLFSGGFSGAEEMFSSQGQSFEPSGPSENPLTSKVPSAAGMFSSEIDTPFPSSDITSAVEMFSARTQEMDTMAPSDLGDASSKELATPVSTTDGIFSTIEKTKEITVAAPPIVSSANPSHAEAMFPPEANSETLFEASEDAAALFSSDDQFPVSNTAESLFSSTTDIPLSSESDLSDAKSNTVGESDSVVCSTTKANSYVSELSLPGSEFDESIDSYSDEPTAPPPVMVGTTIEEELDQELATNPELEPKEPMMPSPPKSAAALFGGSAELPQGSPTKPFVEEEGTAVAADLFANSQDHDYFSSTGFDSSANHFATSAAPDTASHFAESPANLFAQQPAAHAFESPQTTAAAWPTESNSPAAHAFESSQTTAAAWPTESNSPAAHAFEGPQTTAAAWPTESNSPAAHAFEGPQTTAAAWPTESNSPAAQAQPTSDNSFSQVSQPGFGSSPSYSPAAQAQPTADNLFAQAPQAGFGQSPNSSGGYNQPHAAHHDGYQGYDQQAYHPSSSSPAMQHQTFMQPVSSPYASSTSTAHGGGGFSPAYGQPVTQSPVMSAQGVPSPHVGYEMPSEQPTYYDQQPPQQHYEMPQYPPASYHGDSVAISPHLLNKSLQYDQQQASTNSVPFSPTTTASFRNEQTKPHGCIVSFGFGGKLIVMFPKLKVSLNKTKQTGFEEKSQGSLRKGPILVYQANQVLHADPHIQQMRVFPGPLLSNPALNISDYINSQIELMSNEDERLLWTVMGIFVQYQGVLRSEKGISDPHSPESAFGQALQESERRREGSLLPAQEPATLSPISSEETEAAKKKLRELLLVGDRKQAVEVALKAQLWPQAMLFASYIDTTTYTHVVSTFVNSTYGVGDPLRTLCMAFGGQDERSVQDPIPKTKPDEHVSPTLSNWTSHANIMLSNVTNVTNKVLRELGDRLWAELGSVAAAHTCYLIGKVPVEAPANTSRMSLIGANHRDPTEARCYVSPYAVQLTEIYEWVKLVCQQSNPMIPFQGYKLIYAMQLADYGEIDRAFQYVQSVSAILQNVDSSSPYVSSLKTQLMVFEDRLRHHMGPARVAQADVNKHVLSRSLAFMNKGAVTMSQPQAPVPPPQQQPAAPIPPHVPAVEPTAAPVITASALPPHLQKQAFHRPRGPVGLSDSKTSFDSAPSSYHGGTSVGAMMTDSLSRSEMSAAAASAKQSQRSKTPPPSGSKTAPSSTGSGSGWFSGLSSYFTEKMNPDAKVAKLGTQLEAFYCEEKKRWIFPGEDASEAAGPPPAPPTDMFLSAPKPNTPAPSAAADDPLAALMAPPASRAHLPPSTASDPLSAMMAPPSRGPVYGAAASQRGRKKAGARPQFAVFKPT